MVGRRLKNFQRRHGQIGAAAVHCGEFRTATTQAGPGMQFFCVFLSFKACGQLSFGRCLNTLAVIPHKVHRGFQPMSAV
jgi:hypothetical protein